MCVCDVRLSGFSLTTDASTNNPNPPKSKMRKCALCSPHHYFHFFLCLPLSLYLSLPLFLIYDESLPWALGWKLRIWPTRSLWLTHIHLKMSHLLPVQTFYSPTVHSRRQLYSHWARVWARKPAAFDGYICAQAVALADTLRKPAMICNVTFIALNSIKQPWDLLYWANIGFWHIINK